MTIIIYLPFAEIIDETGAVTSRTDTDYVGRTGRRKDRAAAVSRIKSRVERVREQIPRHPVKFHIGIPAHHLKGDIETVTHTGITTQQKVIGNLTGIVTVGIRLHTPHILLPVYHRRVGKERVAGRTDIRRRDLQHHRGVRLII